MKRPLILVVDDEKDIQRVAVRVLESLGYGLVLAPNGEAGLEIARRYKPDLVLSDALMPKLDGREMCLRLKNDPETAGIKVVGKHALKNSSAPVLTVVGLQVAYLLGGTVVVESIFGIAGLGTYVITAVQQNDLPAIQGSVLLIAVLTVLVNLVVEADSMAESAALARRAASVLKGSLPDAVKVLGPAFAVRSKIAGRYRSQILLKVPRREHPRARAAIRVMLKDDALLRSTLVDIDPMSLS